MAKTDPYELQVKEMIIKNGSLFKGTGRRCVISEKLFKEIGLRIDLGVLTEFGGMIGIEIKTAHDSTQRLNKQLRAYKLICERTYVVVPDERYDEVRRFLMKHRHDSVGIISYATGSDGTMYPGIMKESFTDVTFTPKAFLKCLWREELFFLRYSMTHKASDNNITKHYNNCRSNKASIIDGIIKINGLRGYQLGVNLLAHLGSYGSSWAQEKELVRYNFTDGEV